MLVSDLIKAGLRKIGALSVGEGILPIQEIPSGEYADLLQALQVMLRSWAQKQILVYSSTRESFTLIPGQSLYTWGTSGNISTTRPHQILDSFIRDLNGTDVLVKIISEGTYNNLSLKTNIGRPSYLFYQPGYSLVNLYLYPVPQIAETLWLISLKPFTETSSFSAITDTLSFPPNYEEALIYNFAIRIAPEYGIKISSEVTAIAADSYASLVSLNASNQVEPISILLPAGNNTRRYNINLGV